MGGLICLGVIAFFIWILVVSLGGGSYAKLVKSGLPARGILLAVNPLGTKSAGGIFTVELRNMTIDVEMPGRAPFEVKVRAIVPTNLRQLVLPGATVELRVDPKNDKNIAVVGPGSGYAMPAHAPAVRNP